MIKNTNDSPSLFCNLSDMLSQSYPPYQLADKIDWEKLETAFQPLYCQDNGRPGKPIRLMYGLLILKHLRNLSDEYVTYPTDARLHKKIVKKALGYMIQKTYEILF